MQEHKRSKLSLTEEGAQYAENGMPEAQILHRVAQAGAAGIAQVELQVISLLYQQMAWLLPLGRLLPQADGQL